MLNAVVLYRALYNLTFIQRIEVQPCVFQLENLVVGVYFMEPTILTIMRQ